MQTNNGELHRMFKKISMQQLREWPGSGKPTPVVLASAVAGLLC